MRAYAPLYISILLFHIHYIFFIYNIIKWYHFLIEQFRNSGRGKKKLLKTILPLLLAAKVKIGALATLAYFGIALLAKKAILASIISIAISAFIGLKALWAQKHGLHHDTTGYSAGWSSGAGAGWAAPVASSGWSSGGSGWDDAHGAYSAQTQAYSGYHRK